MVSKAASSATLSRRDWTTPTADGRRASRAEPSTGRTRPVPTPRPGPSGTPGRTRLRSRQARLPRHERAQLPRRRPAGQVFQVAPSTGPPPPARTPRPARSGQPGAAQGYESGRLGYPTTGPNVDGQRRRSPGLPKRLHLLDRRHRRARQLRPDPGQLGPPRALKAENSATPPQTSSATPAAALPRYTKGFHYWTAATGAHATSGPIRTAWAAQGFEGGQLGYPTAGERPTVNGGSPSRPSRAWCDLLDGDHRRPRHIRGDPCSVGSAGLRRRQARLPHRGRSADSQWGYRPDLPGRRDLLDRSHGRPRQRRPYPGSVGAWATKAAYWVSPTDG